MCGLFVSTRSLLSTSTLIALGLFTQSASAAFTVVTNDSVISASSSVTRYDSSTFQLLGSHSASASQTFAAATGIPGTTAGSVNATASAAGSTLPVNSSISYSLTDNTGVIGVSGMSGGNAFGFGSLLPISVVSFDFTSIFDVTFQLTTTGYSYSLFFQTNGVGGGFGSLELIDVANSTQLAYMGLTLNNADSRFGVLNPGLYRMKVTSQRSASNVQSANTSFSNGLSGQFAPVPIPAAAWLFGGALAGLAALKRRQAQA
jgi:hypothetical protein